MEATKNICCVKGEDTVDHSSVTRELKEFCPDCKSLDDKGRSKTMDVLQDIEANLVRST